MPTNPRKHSSKKSPRTPTALDVEIGKRVREARKAAGVSQEELAAAVGTTFQQVQKYEVGRNRVAASRLVEIAGFLKVSPAWLLIGERANEGERSTGKKLTGAPGKGRQSAKQAAKAQKMAASVVDQELAKQDERGHVKARRRKRLMDMPDELKSAQRSKRSR